MAPFMLILRQGRYTAMLVSTFTATGAPRAPVAVEATGTDHRIAPGTDRLVPATAAAAPGGAQESQARLSTRRKP